MKHNIELLRADILNELDKLELIRKELQLVAEKFELNSEQVPTYDRAAIGYFLHNFYNGCENIFHSIAKFFENDLAPDTWHADLLKRMRLSIPGFRPAVINENLYVILNDFRGFRHIYRHSYAFELNWERERAVARQLEKTTKMLTQQIHAFLAHLNHLL
ncbi:MAG: antitoxin [Deltaproteobacteria bacterium]|nr:antitoxin [Candidatus Tharpella aukensis]